MSDDCIPKPPVWHRISGRLTTRAQKSLQQCEKQFGPYMDWQDLRHRVAFTSELAMTRNCGATTITEIRMIIEDAAPEPGHPHDELFERVTLAMLAGSNLANLATVEDVGLLLHFAHRITNKIRSSFVPKEAPDA